MHPTTSNPSTLAVMASSSQQLLRSILQSEVEAVQQMHELRAQFVKERLDEQLKFDAAMGRAQQQRQEEEDQDRCFPPRAGRPDRGFTSGALQIAAEHHRGFAPPYGKQYRSGYRDVIREGTLVSPFLSPVLERPGGCLTDEKVATVVSLGSGLGALNPGMIKEANEVLKQPHYHDKGFDLPLSARGDALSRKLLIAADLDAAAEEEEQFLVERERALLRMLPAVASGSSSSLLSSSELNTTTIMMKEDPSAAVAVPTTAAATAATPASAPEVVMAAPLPEVEMA